MIFFSRDQERDIYEAMASVRLRPGQALWLGPQALRILAGEDKHEGGPLPGKMILEPEDWRCK